MVDNGKCRFLLTDNDNFCAFIRVPKTQCAMLGNNELVGQKILMHDVQCKTVFTGDEGEKRIVHSIMTPFFKMYKSFTVGWKKLVGIWRLF